MEKRGQDSNHCIVDEEEEELKKKKKLFFFLYTKLFSFLFFITTDAISRLIAAFWLAPMCLVTRARAP